MNKPASELIALADDPQVVAVAQQAIMKHPFFEGGATLAFGLARTVLMAVAANQSGSERAGVDAHPRWRHKKRGTTYVEIGRGKIQSENWCNRTGPMDLSPVDMAEVVIYRSDDDGSLWVRPFIEFYDGRFEALATPPEQPALAATHGKPDGAVREALRAICKAGNELGCSCADRNYQWFDQSCKELMADAFRKMLADEAALHSPKPAETSPGDVGRTAPITCPNCHDESDCSNVDICNAVEAAYSSDVKAEAKSQEPEAVAVKPEWKPLVRTVADLVNNLLTVDQSMEVHAAYFINYNDGRKEARTRSPSISRERVNNSRINTGDDTVPYSLVIWTSQDERTHPTTKPEAPAVGVDAIKDLVRSFHRNSCYPEAGTGELNAVVNAIAALIAEGR